LCFLPELLNGSLSMEKLRGGPKALDVSAELDMYWADAYLGRKGSAPAPLPLDSLVASRLENWLERLGIELDGQACKYWKIWAKSYLTEILFALGGSYRALDGGGTASIPKVLSDEDPIAAVVSYLHENYSDPGLTVGMMCARFATNKTSLQRSFREHTGRSLAAYLRHYRLSVARSLVEGSSMTVSDIAESVGFLDITGLERAFKRSYGFAPLAYRRLARGKPPSQA
jgi:AraC-like DNA-binding protein